MLPTTSGISPTPWEWNEPVPGQAVGRGQRKSKLPLTFLLGVPKSGKAKCLNVFSASLLLSLSESQSHKIVWVQRDISKSSSPTPPEWHWKITCFIAKVTWGAYRFYCVCSLGKNWWRWRWTGGRDWLTFVGRKKAKVTAGEKTCLRNAGEFGRSLLKVSV